ncbi:hypothetical protein GTO91_15890, partial [Heliobacterium undosum]
MVEKNRMPFLVGGRVEVHWTKNGAGQGIPLTLLPAEKQGYAGRIERVLQSVRYATVWQVAHMAFDGRMEIARRHLDALVRAGFLQRHQIVVPFTGEKEKPSGDGKEKEPLFHLLASRELFAPSDEEDRPAPPRAGVYFYNLRGIVPKETDSVLLKILTANQLAARLARESVDFEWAVLGGRPWTAVVKTIAMTYHVAVLQRVQGEIDRIVNDLRWMTDEKVLFILPDRSM